MRCAEFEIRKLLPGDAPLLEGMNELFARAFDDAVTYSGARPGLDYLQALLQQEGFIAIAASAADQLVGGLVAYELSKAEQIRREVYIYDLAVEESHRRRGIATAMIGELKGLASSRGVWAIFVQADYGDEPAIGLYEKLGIREDVLHFDIIVDAGSRDGGWT